MKEKQKSKAAFSHAQNAAATYRAALPNNATIFQRIWFWLTTPPTQKSNNRLGAITAVIAVALIVLAMHFAKLIGSTPAYILPGEIDLSGAWKINYEDKALFSKKNLDDSNWCISGVPDPRFAQGTNQPASCSPDFYRPEKMRGNTYWYRKEVFLSKEFRPSNPSIFFGAIKHNAEIYWDGKFIGATTQDNYSISSVVVPAQLITPGKHIVAVRVSSLDGKYPGIFHGYPRKVTLGEKSNETPIVLRNLKFNFVIPAITLTIQALIVLVLISLLIKGQANGEKFYWLLLYFSSYAGYSILVSTSGPQSQSLRLIAACMGSLAIIGWGLEFHVWMRAAKFAFRRALVTANFFLVFCLIPAVLTWSISPTSLQNMATTLSIAPLFLYGFSFAWNIFQKRGLYFSKTTDWPTLISLLLMHVSNGLDKTVGLSIPILTGSPLITCSLSLLVMYFAIDQYTRQERELAFLGRFIRPGLKTLLKEQGAHTDNKMFRGRKIPILKIDIVNHTLTTYQMPFGIKRLFQDLWFTHVDQVTHDLVFLDKNIGDGSIYCFREDIPGGSCSAVLKAALEIRDVATRNFDEDFFEKLRSLLQITPELELPAQRYFKAYKERASQDFFSRKTEIRIGLVYGFVDEGMWGLSAQSHYDVQGDLVSLAARIEAKAEIGEIVMDKDFLSQLLAEGKYTPDEFQERQVELKGIGATSIWAWQQRLEKKKAA